MVNKTIHIIPHTHWDREWYRSADAFLIRLTFSVDMIIECLEQNQEFSYYTLDGQTAILEDYLKIKPNNRPKLEKLVSAGRLFIGPWYIQPDLNLVNGESLIRNLLIGGNQARSFGRCMNVGWIPDAFGQIAGTPQLFKSFGLEGLFVWRGFDYEMLSDSLFRWTAPNGDSLPAVHFPLGYGYYRYFPNDKEQRKKELKMIHEAFKNRYQSGQYLHMHGSDHARIQGELPHIMEQDRELLTKHGFKAKISHPEAFLAESLEAYNSKPLQDFRGEARSPKLGRIHAGISSTRMDIKARMRENERMLTQVIEPMSTMLTSLGSQYTQEIVNHFWKILLKNQFHDSIYSSSPETVNQAVENRLLSLRHGLAELIWLNHRFLMKNIKFDQPTGESEIITIFNTQPYAKSNTTVIIDAYLSSKNFTITTQKGTQVPYVLLQKQYHQSNEIENYSGLFHLNDEYKHEQQELRKKSIQITIAKIEALSYQVLQLNQGQQAPPPTIKTDLAHEKQTKTMENSYLKIEINNNGTLEIFSKKVGTRLSQALTFTDSLDDGDEYNYAPPAVDVVKTTATSQPLIELIEDNPQLVTYGITHVLIFAGISDYGRWGEVKLTTFVSLTNNSQVVTFKTEITNNVDDHLLRVIFRGNKKTRATTAQDHFGYIVRSNHIDNSKDVKALEATEQQLPIYPLNDAVMMGTKEPEFIILSKTVSEYTVIDDDKLALTLLRATGKLGKSDLSIRPGRASGYHLATPSSQMKRGYTLEYALTFATKSMLPIVYSEYAYGLQGRHIKTIEQYTAGILPWSSPSYLTLDPRLTLLACKKAEHGDKTVVRVLNQADIAIEAVKIMVGIEFAAAVILDSNEVIISNLAIEKQTITITKISGMSFMTIGLLTNQHEKSV
ncbi:MAG: glycoside hydrolase family 38 C-terminal domain-containing protein [Culicoidibacterales bacterium]